MLMLRQLVKSTKIIIPYARTMAAQSSPLVDLTVDDDGIAILTMNRPPVNSLNLELLQDISKSLDEVEKLKPKGMILASSSPTVFSAGLDLTEMYKPDLKRAETFWSTLQEVWIKLFGSNFITAAAINGHAPAGGCLLSLSCEYRAMVRGKYSIGLNETTIGIVAPTWFVDSLCHTIPKRHAEIALTSGQLFSVDEALKVGMIDETVADKSEAIEKCKNFINRFKNIPPLARSFTKQRLRNGPILRLQNNRKQDIAEFIGFLENPLVQKSMEKYIQALKKKAAK